MKDRRSYSQKEITVRILNLLLPKWLRGDQRRKFYMPKGSRFKSNLELFSYTKLGCEVSEGCIPADIGIFPARFFKFVLNTSFYLLCKKDCLILFVYCIFLPNGFCIGSWPDIASDYC